MKDTINYKLLQQLIEACRAAKSFIDDDAEAYPQPGGYTLAQMKRVLNDVLKVAEIAFSSE